MIRIDGSFGEGGGLILRTSLSLSLATGKPFRIENIRAGRERPGLLRRHLTAVLAAAEVGAAAVDGATVGSTALTSSPGRVRAGGGRFCAQIETAAMLNWNKDCGKIDQTRNSPGPGNILMVRIGTAEVPEIFSAFGQVGVSSEKVASMAARDAREYPVSRAAADEHLTDQLLLPMALAGAGSFTAEKINAHSRTNMAVISEFLAVRFGTRDDNGFTRVRVAN